MRFKDLRLHIFLSLFLIILYVFFFMFYLVTTNGVTSSSAISQAETFWQTKITEANTNIDYYLNAVKNNSNTNINYLSEIDTAIFENKSYLITTYNNVDTTSSNTTSYLFIKNDDKLAYVSLDKIFTTYNDDESFFLYNENGEILYSNKNNYKTKTIADYFSINPNEYNNYKSRIDKGIVISKDYNDLFFAYHIDSFGNTLSTDKLHMQSLIFYTGAFVTLLLSFFIILLGFKKASRLILIDKHNYNRAKSIVIKVNKKGKIIFVNKVFKSLFNYESFVKSITDFKAVGAPIIECIKKEQSFIATINRNGQDYYLSLASIYSHGCYYLIGFDDTKQYINNQYLLQMLSKNTLTNLDNSLSLTANYMDILDLTKTEYVSLALINIVGFRETNKVFGRRIGDQILIAFARLLEEKFNGMKIYHMDADRFCVVFHNRNERVAQELCNSLILTLKTPLLVQNNHIFVRIKIGIYNMDAPSTIALEDAKNKLDISLQRAMNTATRDIIVYDYAIENYVNESNKMERDLLEAINKHEFEMYFQPQYDIFAERIVSFEALIRWNNPLYSRQSPQIFIEMAEHNGFILEIGKFVIEESFKAAKKLEPYNCHVSINVSPAQLLQAGFVSDIISEFNKNELKPGSIAIEITETFVMENFDVMLEKLDSLKRQGFSIHLDDFGTGYSSLLYLKELPADVLKIDKEFTNGIESDKYSLTMVDHICKIGNDLGLDIICEGVETEAQKALLKKMNCRIIQGWLIGKAMQLDKAIELIHKLNIDSPKTPEKKTTKRKGSK